MVSSDSFNLTETFDDALHDLRFRRFPLPDNVEAAQRVIRQLAKNMKRSKSKLKAYLETREFLTRRCWQLATTLCGLFLFFWSACDCSCGCVCVCICMASAMWTQSCVLKCVAPTMKKSIDSSGGLNAGSNFTRSRRQPHIVSSFHHLRVLCLLFRALMGPDFDAWKLVVKDPRMLKVSLDAHDSFVYAVRFLTHRRILCCFMSPVVFACSCVFWKD